jgi:hypothetical protein
VTAPRTGSVLVRVAALAGVAAMPAWFIAGPGGVLLVAIAVALWLVWRVDNWTGSCLMIAVLLLLVLGVLTLLLALMAMQR